MKFRSITLRERMDFQPRLRENDFSFSVTRGWTLDSADGGVVCSHAELELPIWIAGAGIARGEVLVEKAKGK